MVSVYCGLLVLLFVVFFQPGQTNPLPFFENLLAAAIYAVTTFFILSCSQVFLQRLLIREPGTNLKLILWCGFNLILIGNGNSLVSFFILGNPAEFDSYLQIQAGTFSSGIICLLLVIFIYQNHLFHRAIKNKKAVLVDGMAPEVKFSAENPEHDIWLKTDRIYLVRAMENYVKVFYRGDDGIIANRILRTTLKKTEKDLRYYGEFLRCHRSCIVNIKKILMINKRASGYQISLDGIEDAIPVTRSMNAKIKKLLHS